MSELRIGTRGSRLALAQAQWVVARLEARMPGLVCRTVIIQTSGDKFYQAPLADIAGRGVFTLEIEEALRRGDIDLAVHSLKDLPTEPAPGLEVAAISEREDPHDVIAAHAHLSWRHASPAGAGGEAPRTLRIGTSSLRRRAQLLAINPALEIVEVRGNVPTRLQKARDGEIDAVVLAAAGLRRLGIVPPWLERLDDVMLPAPGQGALGLQIREGDAAAREAAMELNDETGAAECIAERAFMQRLGGGCRAPIAAWGKIQAVGTNPPQHAGGSTARDPFADAHLRLEGFVSTPDGVRAFRGTEEGPASEAYAIGVRLADRLLREGAGEIIDAIRRDENPAAAQSFLQQANRKDAAKPLAGKRVVVTRAEDADGPLSAALRDLGAEPILLPLIDEAAPVDPGPMHDAARRVDEFDWIVFTSARAAQSFEEALAREGKSLRQARAKLACAGPKTAQTTAEIAGRSVDVVPATPGARELLDALVERALPAPGTPIRVLFPAAEGALSIIPEGLRARGAIVEQCTAYRTVRLHAEPAALDQVRAGDVDAITFASPSAVEAFEDVIGPDAAKKLSARVIFAAVGPTTQEAMEARGWRVEVVSGERTFEGLVKALAIAKATAE